MSLIDNLIFKGILEDSVVEKLGSSAQQLSDFEKLHQLVRRELVSEDRIINYLSQRYHTPIFTSSPETVLSDNDSSVFRQIYEETSIFIFRKDTHFVGLLSLYSDWFSIDRVMFSIKEPVKWYLATHLQIQTCLQLLNYDEKNTVDLSVSNQIYQFLEEAVASRASDIHFEPGENSLFVRFRIDGHLQDIKKISLELQSLISSRIKILGGMDIAIRRRPQDGHFTYTSRDGHLFDLRISSLPTETGEKIVLRLLDQTPIQYKLEALGFLKEDLEILNKAIHSQSGLILIVGPTGSGKTTTLYAMLNALNSREKNILTIEDPVEYHIEGINQVSVQPEQGLSFAQTLRSALRQDPDIILLGEIRDEETAEIAVKASLTGHLVLSTLHSIDVVTTIQRLSNLGIDLNLLADTLKLVISQRLVRRLCTHDSDEQETCTRCHGTGYSGRIPVYEILLVNSIIRERIRKGNIGHELVAAHESLCFHSFHQTSQRLLDNQLTDEQEVRSIMMDI